MMTSMLHKVFYIKIHGRRYLRRRNTREGRHLQNKSAITTIRKSLIKYFASKKCFSNRIV